MRDQTTTGKKENRRDSTAGRAPFVVDVRLHLRIYTNVALTSPAKGNVSRFHEREDFVVSLEFISWAARGDNRRDCPDARFDDYFTEDFVGDNAFDRSG